MLRALLYFIGSLIPSVVFMQAFETWEAEEEAAAQQLVRQQAGVGRGKGAKGKAKVTAAAKGGKAKKKKGSDSEDEEDEWSDEDDDFDEDYEVRGFLGRCRWSG